MNILSDYDDLNIVTKTSKKVVCLLSYAMCVAHTHEHAGNTNWTCAILYKEEEEEMMMQ